jgi:FG-GAP repeat
MSATVMSVARKLLAALVACSSTAVLSVLVISTLATAAPLGMNEAGDAFGGAVAVGDFNGDGLKDLAIGAPGEDSEAGAVFVFRGSSSGLTAWQRLDHRGSDVNGDRFGFSLAAGDFDHDGFDDLAVGAPFSDAPFSEEGFVVVFRGSSGGLIARREFGRVTEGPHFGWSLAAGDFDHDGFDDLAVGAPDSFFATGSVFVIRGSSGGLNDCPGFPPLTCIARLDQGIELNLTGDRFGSSLAAGDFDHDGFDDLAVGAPFDTGLSNPGPETGSVFVFRGSSGGLTAWQRLDQRGLGVNEDRDFFGDSLAAGDFNHDGFDDLAVGAPGEAPGSDPRSGFVFVFRGSSGGLTAWQGLDQRGLGVNERGDGFGSSLAAGDFNHDGFDDLAVGAPDEAPGSDPRSGFVFVFRGSSGGLTAWQGLDQRVADINENGDRFGDSLAAGDFDNNGFDDLAVGAPGKSFDAGAVGAGAVFVFRGFSSGLVASRFPLDQESGTCSVSLCGSDLPPCCTGACLPSGPGGTRLCTPP